jgi:hypothetical protein
MDGGRTVKDLISEYCTAFKTLASDKVAQFVLQLRREYMLPSMYKGRIIKGRNQRKPVL